MSQKLRIKIITKLAQTPPSANLPTAGVAQSTSIAGSPSSFIASNWFPSILIGFQPRNEAWINDLCNILNIALYYSSNGKVDLSWMRSVNFNFGTDQAPSIELKNLMIFSKLVYQTILTNLGQPYSQALNPIDIKKKADYLYNHQILNTLPATNTASQLGTKIGGNLKDLIKNYLQQIK